nr:reverse transcriptase domain-containing protein [Tanacetum cinerariifolium]
MLQALYQILLARSYQILQQDHLNDEGPECAKFIDQAYAFSFLARGGSPDLARKEPPRSIQTWDDLVSKFINQFFTPSKTTNLRNEITRFQQRFDESFYEAWERFNDLLRACPHHGFSELHQLDTFYNALNVNDQDSLNSAAGGNFLDKMPREIPRTGYPGPHIMPRRFPGAPMDQSLGQSFNGYMSPPRGFGRDGPRDFGMTFTPTEPVDFLSMGDEHLNTIPTTESDEFIKSCVENLVPNSSESEGESECDVPAGFTTFSNVLFDDDYDSDSSDDQSLSDEAVREKIYLNPLFDEEIIPMEIDQHSFNAESNLIESMPNHDSSVIISSKIDSLFDEFAEIVSDNSNADIESFSPSPIPNEDSDSHIEEIDLYFNMDDPMPLGMEEDDDDSERDMPILDELLDNYSLSLPANESYHFDIPLPYRPPAKPPDSNIGTLNIKMLGDVSDKKVHIPNLTITRVLNQEKSPAFLSHPGFEAFQSSAECPMIIDEKNTSFLDVPLFHFYPLDQFKYGGN